MARGGPGGGWDGARRYGRTARGDLRGETARGGVKRRPARFGLRCAHMLQFKSMRVLHGGLEPLGGPQASARPKAFGPPRGLAVPRRLTICRLCASKLTTWGRLLQVPAKPQLGASKAVREQLCARLAGRACVNNGAGRRQRLFEGTGRWGRARAREDAGGARTAPFHRFTACAPRAREACARPHICGLPAKPAEAGAAAAAAS